MATEVILFQICLTRKEGKVLVWKDAKELRSSDMVSLLSSRAGLGKAEWIWVNVLFRRLRDKLEQWCFSWTSQAQRLLLGVAECLHLPHLTQSGFQQPSRWFQMQVERNSTSTPEVFAQLVRFGSELEVGSGNPTSSSFQKAPWKWQFRNIAKDNCLVVDNDAWRDL